MDEITFTEDHACNVCYDFCESVTVTEFTAGCYMFVCPNCGEENIYFNN